MILTLWVLKGGVQIASEALLRTMTPAGLVVGVPLEL